MGLQTSLLVKDDAATPKEWTFIAITDTPIPFWRGNDAALPIYGQPRLYASSELLKSGSYKITAKLELPILETLGASGTALGYVAPPKVAHVVTGIFTMFVDPRSTVIDRSNCLKMIVGCLQGATSTTATGTLNQASAGSAFANSAASIVNIFNNLVVPS